MDGDPHGMDGDDTSAEIFWRAHLRTGFGVFLGEAVATASYLTVAPSSPHRAVLWAMAIVWIASGAVNLALVPRVAAQPWRAKFSETWTVLSAFAVGAFAILDHGIDSPVIVLLFLPVGYAALAFTPRATAACGLSTLVAAAMVMAADPDVRLSTESVFMLVAALIGASVLAVAAAANRVGRERREQVLMKRIAELAAVDGLTGCVVHRVFHERIAQEMARSRRHGHPLSLMIIDLDKFKGVNDTYGHLVGDIVLAGAGKALRDHARRSDLVGRVGGDEFAVLMPDTEPETAVALAERIRAELPSTLEVPMTLSIGVSGLDLSASTSEQLLDDADFALYEVKRAGRDGVAARSPGPAPPRQAPASPQPSGS